MITIGRITRIALRDSVITNGEKLAMTNFATKFLVAGAVVALAFAMSVAPTEAAKKRKMMSHGCTTWQLCSTNCSGNGCFMNVCGEDGKWYPALATPVCIGTTCPHKC